ncbi:hypothetical protein T484DRAFT_1916371, partial [Baffinella frigidus]
MAQAPGFAPLLGADMPTRMDSNMKGLEPSFATDARVGPAKLSPKRREGSLSDEAPSPGVSSPRGPSRDRPRMAPTAPHERAPTTPREMAQTASRFENPSKSAGLPASSASSVKPVASSVKTVASSVKPVASSGKPVASSVTRQPLSSEAASNGDRRKAGEGERVGGERV